jgi:hypothetical protein
MKSKYSILCFIFFIFIVGAAQAQPFEKSKVISKTFPVSRQSQVKITNKYGNVLLTTWDKDSIAVSISVKVSDKKETDAVSKLANIDASFTNTSYFIDVQTIFKDNGNKNILKDDWYDITSSIFNSSRPVSIDYNIIIPEWTDIEINNRYGNVYTSNHTGAFKLNLSNGDFKAHDLNGESSVMVDFGNVTLNSMLSGKMDIGNSEVILKNAGKIHVEGRSTKFWITRAISLDLDSRRDKFYIDTLNSLSGQCNFSYVQIANLKSDVAIKTSYGDMKLNSLTSTFSNINLNSEYTDIIITVPAIVAYSLIADYKKTVFTLPPGVNNLQTQLIDEKAQQYHVTGMVGAVGTSTANILINAVSGSVTLISR